MIDYIYSADKTVFFWINDLARHNSFIDSLMKLLSGDIFLPVVIYLVLMAVWFLGRNQTLRERNQRAVFCALAGMGFTNLMIKICNIFYDRVRPYDAFPGQVKLLIHPSSDPSFPSNISAVCFATAIGVWTYNRKMGYILLIPAILISFSRIYVGVHYPLDIVGGFLFAIIGVSIAWLVLQLAEPVIAKALRLMRKIYLA